MLATVAAYSSPEQREQEKIAQTIERAVRLPAGAFPLARYARAYAFASANRVSAIYFIPDDDPSNTSCTSAKAGGTANAGQIALLCAPPDGLKEGERRWFKNAQTLPHVDDGACFYIDIEFDLTRNVVISARCHGGT
ncbi:hypothetical protein OF829_15575 [Sphingomonas sp. LB-2]|nr:hypothetical protein [Sphingomonas caeni]